jgi:serine protease Do
MVANHNSAARLTPPDVFRGTWHHKLILAAAMLLVVGDGRVAGSDVTLPEDSASLSAVCVSLKAATVRLISGTDVSSGVIISREGHILTVAHGLKKEHDSAIVLFHDGVVSEAAVLLRDTNVDAAVLKLKSLPSDRPLIPISTRPVATTDKGISVIAAGYPGREKNGLSPVMRVGELLAVEATSLRSSCALTAGDSGGPLVDLSGRLIGLHRQIGLGAESNHHIPVERIADAVKPLLDLRQTSLSSPATIQTSSALSRTMPVISEAVIKVCRDRTVEIFQGESLERVALGTLLDQQHVATKLSALTPDAAIHCRFADGSKTLSTLVKSKVALDFCILKLSTSREGVIALDSVGIDETGLLYLPIAASIGTDGQIRSGLLTRVQHVEPSLVGKLGALLEVDHEAKAVRVKSVAPNSTAANARLLTGDRISRLCKQPISSLDDVAVLVRGREPGDWIRFQWERDSMLQSTSAQLQHDPGERFERTEFLDGRSGRVSERRSGFAGVFQHDVALAPDQCGGPVCDLSGQVIAINIARRARESTLAVPLDQALNELQAGP